jgi:hypothetical protein
LAGQWLDLLRVDATIVVYVGVRETIQWLPSQPARENKNTLPQVSSTLELAPHFELITADMPLDALTVHSSLLAHRRINPISVSLTA